MTQGEFSAISQAASMPTAMTSQLRQEELQQPIEQDAVHDVRGGVPVEQLLRELGRPDVADPQPDRAATADPHPPHGVQHQRLDQHDRDNGSTRDSRGAPFSAHGLLRSRARARCLRL